MNFVVILLFYVWLDQNCFADLLQKQDISIDKPERERIEQILDQEMSVLNSAVTENRGLLYLRLVRDTVLGTALGESERSVMKDPIDPTCMTQTDLNYRWRKDGFDYPLLGLTNVGQQGLDTIIRAMLAAHYNNIQGDFVDCGVWRGGTSMVALATMIAYNMTQTRKVILVDDFAPVSRGNLWDEFAAKLLYNEHSLTDYLKTGVAQVSRHFYWLNLRVGNRIQFIKDTTGGLLPPAAFMIYEYEFAWRFAGPTSAGPGPASGFGASCQFRSRSCLSVFFPPRRPNHGVDGRPIVLRANHFQVRIPGGIIQHYKIQIAPDKCPRRVNRMPVPKNFGKLDHQTLL